MSKNSQAGLKQTQVSAAVSSHGQASMQHVVTHHQQVKTIFDPDVLKKYAELVPDAPNRVLAVFEQNSLAETNLRDQALRQQQAGIDLQKHAMDLQSRDNLRRDWMAFAIILAGMATSTVFAAIGKEWLSGGTLIAIIAYAVIGYLQKHKKPA